MKKRSSESGMSLFEVIIAIALLAIVVTMAITAFMYSVNMTSNTYAKYFAASEMVDILNCLRCTGSSALSVTPVGGSNAFIDALDFYGKEYTVDSSGETPVYRFEDEKFVIEVTFTIVTEGETHDTVLNAVATTHSGKRLCDVSEVIR